MAQRLANPQRLPDYLSRALQDRALSYREAQLIFSYSLLVPETQTITLPESLRPAAERLYWMQVRQHSTLH